MLVLGSSIVYAETIDLDHMDILFSKARTMDDETKSFYEGMLRGVFDNAGNLNNFADNFEGYLPKEDLDKLEDLNISTNKIRDNILALKTWSYEDRMALINYGLMTNTEEAKTKINALNDKYIEDENTEENLPDTDSDDSTSSSGGGGFIPPMVSVDPDAPVVNKDVLFTMVNEPITITADKLMANDKNAEIFLSVGKTINGTVEVLNDQITFIPDEDHIGRGVFYYTVVNDVGEDDGIVIINIDQLFLIEDDNTPLSGLTVENRRMQKGLIYKRINEKNISLNFQDTKNHWSNEYVDFFAKREILNGRTPTAFEPDGLIKESEILKFLMAVAVSDENKVNTEEIKLDENYVDQWYSDYLKQAKALGIVQRDYKFNPNEYPSREEIIKMIVNTLEVLEVEIDEETLKYRNNYSDFEKVSESYKDAIIMATNLGIINGNADGTLTPKREIKRGEVAKMVKKLYDIILTD
jgi:hypothetical protein